MQKLLVIILLVSSCANNKSDLKTYGLLNDQLNNSSGTIKEHTFSIAKEIMGKLADPHTHEKAIIWNDKANAFRDTTRWLFEYLDKIKLDAEKNGNFTYPEELYIRLINYQRYASNFETSIQTSCKKEIDLLTLGTDTLKGSQSFKDSLITDTRPEVIISMLSMLQNNVSIIENKAVLFCFEHIGSTFDGFVVLEPLITQNAKHFKSGEKLKIDAGVGAFNLATAPEVSINNEVIKAKENGVFNFQTLVSGSPGKYSIPVMIRYYDMSGIIKKEVIDVTYYIDK